MLSESLESKNYNHNFFKVLFSFDSIYFKVSFKFNFFRDMEQNNGDSSGTSEVPKSTRTLCPS